MGKFSITSGEKDIRVIHQALGKKVIEMLDEKLLSTALDRATEKFHSWDYQQDKKYGV